MYGNGEITSFFLLVVSADGIGGVLFVLKKIGNLKVARKCLSIKLT